MRFSLTQPSPAGRGLSAGAGPIIIPISPTVIPAKAGIYTLAHRRPPPDVRHHPHRHSGAGRNPEPRRLTLDATQHHSHIPTSPSFPRKRESTPRPVATPGTTGFWIPACARMTVGGSGCRYIGVWIPAFAGMTGVGRERRWGWRFSYSVGGAVRLSLTQPSPAGRGLFMACAGPTIIPISPAVIPAKAGIHTPAYRRPPSPAVIPAPHRHSDAGRNPEPRRLTLDATQHHSHIPTSPSFPRKRESTPRPVATPGTTGFWIPACAGITVVGGGCRYIGVWIPAFAGMTGWRRE